MSDTEVVIRLRDFDLTALEAHHGAIYVLSPDWRLLYMNRAWRRFAAENDGEPAISARYPVGASLLDAFSDTRLRDFYVEHYTQCRASNRIWRHEYECSSAEVSRRYQQLVYPLWSGDLLVVNSRLVEVVASAWPLSGDGDTLSDYRDAHGLIHQCAHCRRVTTVSDGACWDWVPAWASEIPDGSSHTFCPTCVGFFYRPQLRR